MKNIILFVFVAIVAMNAAAKAPYQTINLEPFKKTATYPDMRERAVDCVYQSRGYENFEEVIEAKKVGSNYIRHFGRDAIMGVSNSRGDIYISFSWQDITDGQAKTWNISDVCVGYFNYVFKTQKGDAYNVIVRWGFVEVKLNGELILRGDFSKTTHRYFVGTQIDKWVFLQKKE